MCNYLCSVSINVNRIKFDEKPVFISLNLLSVFPLDVYSNHLLKSRWAVSALHHSSNLLHFYEALADITTHQK